MARWLDAGENASPPPSPAKMREMGWIGGRAGKRREERTGQQEGEAGDSEVARHRRERLRLCSVSSTEEANEKKQERDVDVVG